MPDDVNKHGENRSREPKVQDRVDDVLRSGLVRRPVIRQTLDVHSNNIGAAEKPQEGRSEQHGGDFADWQVSPIRLVQPGHGVDGNSSNTARDSEQSPVNDDGQPGQRKVEPTPAETPGGPPSEVRQVFGPYNNYQDHDDAAANRGVNLDQVPPFELAQSQIQNPVRGDVGRHCGQNAGDPEGQYRHQVYVEACPNARGV